MELDQLKYFLKVAELKSFTKAADDLLISQPALSRSIARLETELGIPVFVRKQKTLELTDSGLLLQSRAQQILSIVEDTKAEICDDGKTGRIRIGAIPTIAPYFLPPFLKNFSEQYPSAATVIYEDTTDRLLKSCSQGEIDIAMVALPIAEKYLQAEKLFEEELMLVLPAEHALANRSRIRFEDVETLPFIMLNEVHCLSDNIMSFCRKQSFQPSVIGKTNQLSMVQELVALSHGISLIPKMAMELDRSDRRVYKSFSGPSPLREIAIVWDPHRFQSRMLDNFREQVRKFARKKR